MRGNENALLSATSAEMLREKGEAHPGERLREGGGGGLLRPSIELPVDARQGGPRVIDPAPSSFTTASTY